jgi:hypothetical protein
MIETKCGFDSPSRMNSSDVNENSRVSTSPLISIRLQQLQQSASDAIKKGTLSDVNGYTGKHGATIVERKLAFENAANLAASRSCSIKPPPYPERKGLREDWIRLNSPLKSLPEGREIPRSFTSSRNSSESDRRVSQARIEMPKLLAHVNVLQRASQFAYSEPPPSYEANSSYTYGKSPERSNTDKVEAPRNNVPFLSNFPRNISPSQFQKNVHKDNVPTNDVPIQSDEVMSLWPRVESPERKRAGEQFKTIGQSTGLGCNSGNSARKEDSLKKEDSPVSSSVVVPRKMYSTDRNNDTQRLNQNSQARSEMPSLLAHVKVSERASMFALQDEECRAKSSSNRDEMPSLLAHVKVSERASVYNNHYSDSSKPLVGKYEHLFCKRESFLVMYAEMLFIS